jgi:hypothetical protein
VVLALSACGGAKQENVRTVAELCTKRGGPAEQCHCFAQEIAKQVSASDFARITEHARAAEGEPGAKRIEGEDLRSFRAVQAKARKTCVVSRVTRDNMDQILGDYLVERCLRKEIRPGACRCNWEEFRRRVRPETRLVMAHTAAGDDPKEYPMLPSMAPEVAVANQAAIQKCGF